MGCIEGREQGRVFQFSLRHYGVMSRPGVGIMKHDIVTCYFFIIILHI